MRQPAIEIEVPEKSSDLIASIVSRRWNEAIMWRSRERCGERSLREVINNCFDQREGILSPEDKEVVEMLGTDVYVNLSGLKVSALVAWMRDLLLNNADLPFTYTPTPIPELSDSARQEVLQKVKRELFQSGGLNGDLMSLVRKLKFEQLENERTYAAEAAAKMYTLVKDQCFQGGFRGAMFKFLNDFAVYPFAALHGPIPTMVATQKWQGDRFVSARDVEFQFRPLSVFDVFWTADSRTTQHGTATLVRERMTKQQLYRCLGMKSYIKDNVIKVLERCQTGELDMHWMSRNREQPSPFHFQWGDSATVEVLRHYGLLSGRELQRHGITGLDAHQFYETTVTVVGPYTLQVLVQPNPNCGVRPVYTASFEQTSDRIPGVSICQKIRGIERMYLATLRFLMLNGGYAAGPIGEVDFSRVQRYMSPEDVGDLSPLTLYPTDPDMTGAGGRAFNLFSVPFHGGSFAQLGEYFMGLADRITQIPASLHGEPVGTGANRTFRGMAMLYGNAIKPIQSGIANVDETVFSPLGTLMYDYNMRYSDDPSIKGDAKILALGSTGLIQKEVAKQTAMDTLQLVATAGSAAQGMIEPGVVKWAVNSALEASGVPSEVLEGATTAPQQPPAPSEGLGGSAGVPTPMTAEMAAQGSI